jgi:hypothetical protein
MQREPPQCANTVNGPNQNINLQERLNIMAEPHRITKHCNIENCDKPVDRRGMCGMHYTRWKRHGDPHTKLRDWKPRINAQNGEKFCAQCQTTKSVEQFHLHRGRADGLAEHCRECEIKKLRARVAPATPQEYPEIDPVSAAYLAGLFDGEGCITIYERRITTKRKMSPYSLRLNLSSTHSGVIQWLHQRFGGWVYAYDNRQYKQTAIGFRWHSAARHAAYLLEAMLPYLIIKKPEAEIAIAFQQRVEAYKANRPFLRRSYGTQLSDEEDAIRAAMAQDLRNLKHAYKQFAGPA